ncbi:unnamed protein product, partial [Mesorhabditis spiculigera]
MYLLQPLLLLCLCAVQTNAIVGGLEAEAGEYPSAVTLQVYNQVKKKWLTVCAGSIIDREWVLGAANCFYFGSRRTPANQYRIVAGSTRVTSTSSDDGITQVIQVADVVIHPEMKVDDKPNDELDLFIYNELALIKLSKPLKFGKTVQKIFIPFPENSLISKGKLVDVMAWGKTGMDEPAAEHLRYYRTSIQPKKRCDDAWNYKFPSEIICLMANQFKGVCNGDWGAAAARKIQHEGEEVWVQLGMPTWGSLDCRWDDFAPVVGMDTTKYCDFYKKTIGREICQRLQED